jgi:hypothetical protein
MYPKHENPLVTVAATASIRADAGGIAPGVEKGEGGISGTSTQVGT